MIKIDNTKENDAMTGIDDKENNQNNFHCKATSLTYLSIRHLILFDCKCYYVKDPGKPEDEEHF